MYRAKPNHEAWKLIFQGLDAVPMDEIQKVLGVSTLTAGRLSVMAGEYNRNAREDLDRERYGTPDPIVRPGTLPKYIPKEADRGVRED